MNRPLIAVEDPSVFPGQPRTPAIGGIIATDIEEQLP